MLRTRLFSSRPRPSQQQKQQRKPQAPSTRLLAFDDDERDARARLDCLEAALLGTPSWGHAHVIAGLVFPSPRSKARQAPPPSPPVVAPPQGTHERHPAEAQARARVQDGGQGGSDYDEARVVGTRVVSSDEAGAHVVYSVALRSTDCDRDCAGSESPEVILVRWSAVRALHLQLAPRWPQAWAPGYTKAIAALAPPAPSLRLALRSRGGSCVDPAVTEQRAAAIARYLSALLAQPLLRAHPAVQSFLGRGRLLLKSLGDDTPQAMPSLLPAAPPSKAGPHRHESLAASGVDSTARERGLDLLLASRAMAPFLATQDLRRLALCSRAFRGFERHITTLRPRSTRDVTCPLLRKVLTRLGRLRVSILASKFYGLLESASARSLSARALRAHATERERDEAGWDAFLRALEDGRVPQQLEQLHFEVSSSGVWWMPRLSMGPALRLAAGLCRLPGLRELTLAGANFGSAGAIALAQGLRHTPQLRALVMDHTPIGDAGVLAVADALPGLPELRVLSLGDCAMTEVGSAALAQQFRHLPNLTHLAIDNIEPRPGPFDPSYYDILRGLRHLPRLQDLSSNMNDLGGAGIAILLDSLLHLSDLKSLIMGGCMMRDTDIQAVIATLPSLPKLEFLDASFNLYSETALLSLRRAAKSQGMLPFKVRPFAFMRPGAPHRLYNTLGVWTLR